MATRGLYRNAKKEVDQEYDQLIKQGFTPQRNSDGKTYSWVNDKNQIYTGKLNPTGGRDAEAGFLKTHLTREARQNRLMSEKVSALLPKDRAKSEETVKKDDTTPKPPTPGGPSAGGPAAGGPGDAFTMPDTRGLVPAETIDPNKYPLLPAEPLEDMPLPEIPQLKRKIETVEDIVPIDNGGENDPYVYVNQDEWQKNNSVLKRLWNNKYGTSLAEINAVRKGTTITGDLSSKNVPKTKIVNGKTYTLINNPKYVVPKQRVDVMMAEMIQGGLSTRSVGSLPGKAIAEGQALRSAAAGKKAAEASTKAMSAAEIAREKGSVVAKWNSSNAAGVAKKLAEKSRDIAKRARTWGRVANAQRSGSSVAGTSKVGTAAKTAAESAPKAEVTVTAAAPKGNLQLVPKGKPVQMMGYPNSPVPAAKMPAPNFNGAGLVKVPAGKPAQMGGFPKYQAPENWTQGALWEIPQGPRTAIRTPKVIPGNVNIPSGFGNQTLPLRDATGKYFQVRRESGGKLVPKIRKGN